MRIGFIILLGFLVCCGAPFSNRRSSNKTSSSSYEDLRSTVMKLQGTIQQLEDFAASDFSDCNSALPPFETKICKIAQTATAEQQLIFVGQIQELLKIFQTELYGEDCLDEVESGCPTAESIISRMDVTATQVEDNLDAIQQLQIELLQLQNTIQAFSTRLDNFNGTGESIEAIINNLDVELETIQTVVSDIESELNDGDIYRMFLLCSDIPDSGPSYEPVLMTGDHSKIVAYTRASRDRVGLSVVVEAGVTGDLYTNTTGNTRKCNIKIYDLNTSLKVCWDNSNRRASEADIDLECDYINNFINPTLDCTCY